MIKSHVIRNTWQMLSNPCEARDAFVDRRLTGIYLKICKSYNRLLHSSFSQWNRFSAVESSRIYYEESIFVGSDRSNQKSVLILTAVLKRAFNRKYIHLFTAYRSLCHERLERVMTIFDGYYKKALLRTYYTWAFVTRNMHEIS